MSVNLTARTPLESARELKASIRVVTFEKLSHEKFRRKN